VLIFQTERREQCCPRVAPELQQEGRRQVGLPYQDLAQGVEQALRLCQHGLEDGGGHGRSQR